MQGKSLVSINDLTREEIIDILDMAELYSQQPRQKVLEGHVVATLFFEPSTRTRLSFESAVNQLRGRVLGFAEASSSSVSKGESLKDTILTVSNYVDLIVMRHPIEGAAIPLDNEARDGEGRRLLRGLCCSKRRQGELSTKRQARQEGQQELGLRHI